jgi:hypothetical protein
MANMKYFVDLEGRTIQVKNIGRVSPKNIRGWDEETKCWLQVTRVVEYKRQPSRHECDARCIHATGRVMKCECSCGGKNHGRGY